jgi:hypothetical protein
VINPTSPGIPTFQLNDSVAWSPQNLEPAGGFEHSVRRLRFGCFTIKLHRLMENSATTSRGSTHALPARVPA